MFGALIDRLNGIWSVYVMSTNMYINFWDESLRQWAVAGNAKELNFLSNLQAITGERGFKPGLLHGVPSMYLSFSDRVARLSKLMVPLGVIAALLGGLSKSFSNLIMSLVLAITFFFATMWALVMGIGPFGGAAFGGPWPFTFSVVVAVIAGSLIGFVAYKT